MTTAFYPGSFDPVTLGHLDVIERAVGVFERLVVGVLVNPKKMPLLPLDEREEAIREAVTEQLGDMAGRVEVASFDGLTVDSPGHVPELLRDRFADGLLAFVQWQQRHLLGVHQHAHRRPLENADGAFNDVEVAQRDRVERAGVKSRGHLRMRYSVNIVSPKRRSR